MRKYHTTLISKKRVAKDTIEVSFSRPDGFDFLAGQYLQLGVPQLLSPDPAGSSRVMSIASSPLSQKEICIAFRDTGSGYKNTLKHLKIGASAIIEGPYGFFTLSEKPTYPLVFIAGGIGVTPYLSMLQYASATGLNVPITLLYTNSSNESAAYMKELLELSRYNSSIKVKSTLSRIDEQLIVDNVSDPYNCLWYISGPPAMVASVRNVLFLLGIDDSMICFEEFTGY